MGIDHSEGLLPAYDRLDLTALLARIARQLMAQVDVMRNVERVVASLHNVPDADTGRKLQEVDRVTQTLAALSALLDDIGDEDGLGAVTVRGTIVSRVPLARLKMALLGITASLDEGDIEMF